jgi:hypothetical protein
MRHMRPAVGPLLHLEIISAAMGVAGCIANFSRSKNGSSVWKRWNRDPWHDIEIYLMKQVSVRSSWQSIGSSCTNRKPAFTIKDAWNNQKAFWKVYSEAACCPCVTSLGNKQLLFLTNMRPAVGPLLHLEIISAAMGVAGCIQRFISQGRKTAQVFQNVEIAIHDMFSKTTWWNRTP